MIHQNALVKKPEFQLLNKDQGETQLLEPSTVTVLCAHSSLRLMTAPSES